MVTASSLKRDDLGALIALILSGQVYGKLGEDGEVYFISCDFGGIEDALPIEEIAKRNQWPANWRDLAKGYLP